MTLVKRCVACECIRACSPILDRADAIAFGAIAGSVAAIEHGMKLDDLCEDHQHKLGLLRSVGAFDFGKGEN
jgi:hypothetical protein